MAWEGLNRRKFPRANFPCLIKIAYEKTDVQTILTHTENISTGGVCVILRKHMDLFSRPHVELDLMDDGEPIKCEGKVMWTIRRKATDEIKPSFYDIGIEFVDLTEMQLERLRQVIVQLSRSGKGLVESGKRGMNG